MAEILDKCLVTKLGNTVSGNFPKLGELIIPVTTVGLTLTEKFYCAAGNVLLTDGLIFADDETVEVDNLTSARSQLFKVGVTGNIHIKNKYDLTSFSIGTTNHKCCDVTSLISLEDLVFATKLTDLRGTYDKFKGSVDGFSNHSFTAVRIENNPEVTGNINAFAKSYHARNVAHGQSSSASLFLNACFAYTGITGSIEELVAAIKALGSTASTGEHKCYVTGSHVTFQGNEVTGKSLAQSTLEWTEHTITFAGVTINV